MPLKIKSIVVKRNNLALLGRSTFDSTCTQQRPTGLTGSQSGRLKSLSQERDIRKIIKCIESPSDKDLVRQGIWSNLQLLESQHEVGKKCPQNRKSLLKSCVPHSKISLIDTHSSRVLGRNSIIMPARSKRKAGISISLKAIKLNL